MKKILILFLLPFICFFYYSQQSNLNGSYVNSYNQKMIITNFQQENGFDFLIKEWGVDDDWGCLFSAKGNAIFIDKNNAYFGVDDEWPDLTFTINKNVIEVIPDPDFIGMDCAKYGDSGHISYWIFKK